jgi:hypothetical protein
MSRYLIAILAAGSAVPVGPAAPMPKDPDPFPVYLPTVIGDRWVSVSQLGGHKVETKSEVTVADGSGGASTVTVREEGFEPRTLKSWVEGLYQPSFGKTKHDPPMCLLRLPSGR